MDWVTFLRINLKSLLKMASAQQSERVSRYILHCYTYVVEDNSQSAHLFVSHWYKNIASRGMTVYSHYSVKQVKAFMWERRELFRIKF